MTTPFRERLLDGLRRKRESGIRIRRLNFGAPASAEAIARVEHEHLGFPMPASLRSFFAAHDGASLFIHRVDDLAAEIYDHSVPLAIESEAPVVWSDAMHDGGALSREIAEADFGESQYGGIFYTGVFCVPSLAEIFDTDWGAIMGWPRGTYLFDAFHFFRASALVVDPAKREVRVQPTTDHGADRSAAPVALADYLDNLADNCGIDRVVDGRYV